MDPNLNRNSMGSRAGGANFRNNLATGGGAVGAPSRLGTVGRVYSFFYLGNHCFRRCWIDY
jgi:hypothetical protein